MTYTIHHSSISYPVNLNLPGRRINFSERRIPATLILVSCVLFFLSTQAAAQNVQYNRKAADLGLRSGLTVDPSTHALQIQIPMGSYPGRAGMNLPVTLSYSSKVWRIDYAGYDPGQTHPDGTVVGAYTMVNAQYGEHSASGWTSSLGFPFLDTVTMNHLYDMDGNPTGTTCKVPCYTIDRVLIWMPDGSSHELRSTDQPFASGAARPDDLYSVDSSRLRYQRSTDTLFMPDGSRYLLTNKQYIDRNGNTLTYNAGQWTDTLGHTIIDPLYTRTASYDYSLPGMGNSPIHYTIKWKTLDEPGVLADNQQVNYIADRGCPNGNGSYSTHLFSSESTAYTFICDAGNLHKPSVLYQIVLPTGQTYTFNYNIYGEIVKVTLPTGGYEKYEHAPLMPLSKTTAPYRQANRGVVKRWINVNGSGADNILWQYDYTGTYSGEPDTGSYVLSTTAPDNTLTERYLHTDANSSWGYGASNSDGARVGRAYDERIYSAPDNYGNRRLMRRNLTQWEVTGSNATSQLYGLQNATRDPRAVKEVEILFENGGSSALATTTTYSYDPELNNVAVIRYGFVTLNASLAQTYSIDQIQSGPKLRTDETTYLLRDPNYSSVQEDYRARSLLALPTSTTIKDGLDKVIAHTSIEYDKYPATYPLLDCNPGNTWADPQTDHRGNATTITRWLNFDGNSTSISTFPAGTNLHSDVQFDRCGNVRSTWDATGEINNRGHQTRISYDNSDTYQHVITSPVPDTSGTYGSNAELVTTENHDSYSGRLMSVVEASGQTTNYSYDDPFNRLTSVSYPQTGPTASDKGQVNYSYSDAVQGNPTGNNYLRTQTRIDAARSTDAYQYFDGLGRPSRTLKYDGDASGAWSVSDVHYDDMGRASQISNPYRVSATSSAVPACSANIPCTTTSYDALGRVQSVTTPDAAQVTIAYDVATTLPGSTRTVTDQDNKSRMTVTDGMGRLVQVIEDPGTTGHLNYQTTYSYDRLGNLSQVVQGEQKRSFMYDSLSRLIRAKNPEQQANGALNLNDPLSSNGQWSMGYAYYETGNLKTRTDARGITTTYNYDSLNRNTTVDYSNTALSPDITRHYDDPAVSNSRGRLTSVTSALSTYNYTGYDAMGRVKASSQAADGQPVYTMSYDYDLAGNMTSQIYPSGRVLKTEYDQAGRIAGVRNSGSFYYAGGASSDTTNRIGYTAHGSPGDVRLGNGLWEHTNFNNRLQAYEIGLGTSKGLSDTLKLTYDYDTTDSNGNPAGRNNGNVRRQVINVPGAIGVPDVTLTQMYKYDSLNRLSDAQEVSGSTTTQWQVSSLWQQSYSYDLYGNRTAVASTVGTGQPSLSSIAPEIDSTSNRFKATNSSGQATDYDYDEAGNLKQERVPVSGGTALNTYVYDAENKLLQVSRGNVPQDSYAYDGNGQRIKRTVGNTVTIYVYNIMGQLVAEYSNAQPQQNGTSFVTTDALGSARVVTDISQRVLARYDYLPYGEQMPAGMSGRSASQGYGLETLTQKFTGKEHDYETGLDYFGARYYASIQGRFTSPDPLMASARALNPQSWNRYTYVLNNPLRYVDPFGLQESAEEKKNREEAVKMAQAEADAAGLTREIVVSYAYLFGGGLNSIFRRGGPSTLFLLQLPEPPSDDADDTSSETNSEQDEKKKEELDRIEGIEPIIPAEPSANIPDTSAKAEKVLDEILMQQTPHLDGTTLPEMATDAINRVARFEGTAAQKADLYESFTMQITHRTGGSFGAIRNRGTDGSHIFIGNGGELLVITPQGALYRGSISTGGATPGTIMGTFVPHYNNLRLRTAK